MLELRWLQEKVVRALHQRQLAEHSGMAGVRDAGLLESALARPRNLLAYGQPKPDLPALAAAYAFGIIRNHPFVDGNKRTAYVACRTFLKLNGADFSATDVEKYQIFIALADGSIGEEQLAEWIRAHSV
jgi:death-on-curing protein